MTKRRYKISQLTLSLCLAIGLISAVNGQTPQPTPKKEPAPATPKREMPPKPMSVPIPVGPRAMPPQGERVTTEKSIMVAPDVSIKLCVLEGKLKINGWERDEVRLFVKEGSRAGIKVLEKGGESGKPVWLLVSNMSRPGAGRGQFSDCIYGETVEMDVPMKASLTVSGRTTHTTVDSVKKIIIQNVEGNIALRNIPGGISATTYQGDVSVENSSGAISLESAEGNVIAFEVNPGQIGDLFKAKTNSGAISLQRVEHRQIEANSISGSLLFNGKFLSGGLYRFKTSAGSIRMLLPADSLCTVKASYGYGVLSSELPLKIITQNVTSGGKNVVGTIGEGDAAAGATVNLTTVSGRIGIGKQP
jgi:hypothetical protein